MADDNGYATMNSYLVEKESKGFSTPTVFKDSQGAVFLTSKTEGLTGGKIVLNDNSGKTIGYLTVKIALTVGIGVHTHTYELFDANNQNIGRVVTKQSVIAGMGANILLQDPNGNTIVMAHGNFMNQDFQLDSADGSKAIAKVSSASKIEKGAGIMQNLKNMETNLIWKPYNVEILDTTINEISRLFILEFLMVIEHLSTTGQSGPAVRGMGFRM